MDIPLQEILEVVFAGTMFVALMFTFAVVLSGGRSPEIAKPLVFWLFRIEKTQEPHPDESLESKKSPSGKSKVFHGLNNLLVGLLAVSLIYSLGIAIERISDRLKDGPAKRLLIPRKTDAEIRVAQFRKLFEEEWPETDYKCLPYSDAEITQTYYTAVNYLKLREPPAQQLATIMRRIHFSESMAVIAILGVYAWTLATILLGMWTFIYRRRNKHLPKLDVFTKNQPLVERWAAVRLGRMSLVTVGFWVLFELANYAWTLDEEKFDALVFGYYLTELQKPAGPQEGLSRIAVSEWSQCPPAEQRLEGLADTRRFDASGVAWFELNVSRDDWVAWFKWWILHWESPQRIIVVNDKDSRLTVHAQDGSLKGRIYLPKEIRNVKDLEEITRVGENEFYLLASHSTYNQMEDPQRQHLFRINISGTYHPKDGREVYEVEEYKKIQLVEYLANTHLDKNKTKSLKSGWREPDRECCDTNIEGMAPTTDLKNLLFGFREPLICEDDRLYTPIYRLDLSQQKVKSTVGLQRVTLVPAMDDEGLFPGPQRISGIAYDPKQNLYWILTSYERNDEYQKNRAPTPCDLSEKPTFETTSLVGGGLWTWDGIPGNKPNLYSHTVYHKPEGIAVSHAGKMVIVYDEDNPNLRCLDTPYALFTFSDFPKEPIRPPCAPLMPNSQ
jgi:hypothetical protein